MSALRLAAAAVSCSPFLSNSNYPKALWGASWGLIVETKILLVDNHQMVRDGLRALLERQPGLRVVGDADSGRAAIDRAASLQPDIVVMDIGMQGLNGIEATREIRAQLPGVKIIALSMHSDKRYVVQMFKAGAGAYLLKDCAFDDLVRAISAVQTGQRFLSQGIAATLVDHIIRESPPDRAGSGAATGVHAVQPRGRVTAGDVYSDLTTRQRQVLQLLAEGFTSKEIAREMNVAVKTVETYRRDIMHKLDLHSVAELTRYAIKEGLTTLDE